MNRCFIATLFISTLVLGVVNAQNTLEGKITSQQDQEGIPAATIYISELEKGTAADFDGSYSLTGIPNGNYHVVFSALGFRTVSEQIRFSGDTTIRLNVEMVESALEIQEIIISTPFHRLQNENVMKVERLSTAQLMKAGAPTLAEGLRSVPGMNIISTGTGVGKPVIRGLSSNRVLTYAQGVRLENLQYGDEHGLGINEAGIESVEVIKGPASLLYGSDALGGVLYLNPEKFASPGEYHLDVETSYFSSSRGSSTTAGYRVSGDKLRFLARGSYSTFGDYKMGDMNWATNSRFNEKDLKTGMNYSSNKVRSTLRYNFNQSLLGMPEELEEGKGGRKPEIPFQKVNNHILSLDNTVFWENSSLDVKAGYQDNERREFEENQDVADLRMHLRTADYDLKYHLPEMGAFETIVGVQGMFQTHKNKGPEILIPDATTIDVGALVTTHYHLDRVDLQGGIRYDQRRIDSKSARSESDPGYISALERSFTSVTAALGGKFDFFDAMTTRLNLATGFRAPNLAEMTSHGIHEGTHRYEIGNPELTREQNLQADLSFEYENEHVELFVNGFYNAVSDYIFLAPSGQYIDQYEVYDFLQENARLYGGEIGYHIHPHPLDWLHLEGSFETVTGKLKAGGYLPLIPANAIRNTLRLQWDHGSLFLTLENTFDQEQVSEFETRTGGYSLLNAGVSRIITTGDSEWELSLSGSNLTNKNYFSHLSRLKPLQFLDMGRSFNITAKWKI